MDNTKILLEIKYDIGKIKGKLEGIDNHLTKINGRLDNHSGRINDVEGQCDNLTGKATIVGAVAGFLVALVSVVITFFKK